MKQELKVVAGVLITGLFIFAGILSIRAGISSMSHMSAISLATSSFVLAMITGASTHYQIIKNRLKVESKGQISLNIKKIAA